MKHAYQNPECKVVLQSCADVLTISAVEGVADGDLDSFSFYFR